MRGYAALMLGPIQQHHQRWQQRVDAGDSEVEMADEMARLALRIARLTLFGTDLEERGASIGPALATGQRMIALTRLPGTAFILRGPTP